MRLRPAASRRPCAACPRLRRPLAGGTDESHGRRHGRRRARRAPPCWTRSRAAGVERARRCATTTGSAPPAPAGSAWCGPTGAIVGRLRDPGRRRAGRSAPTTRRSRRWSRRSLELIVSAPAPPRPGTAAPSWPHVCAGAGHRPRAVRRRRARPRRDDSHPYVHLDRDLCIACGRCVRMCAEVQGTFALTLAGRGADTVVAPGTGGPGPSRPAWPAAAASTPARPARSAEPGLAARATGDRDDRTTDHLRLLRRRLRPRRAHPRRRGRRGHCRPATARSTGATPASRAASRTASRAPPTGSPPAAAPRRPRWSRSAGTRRSPSSPAGCARPSAPDGPDAVAAISSARATNEENYLDPEVHAGRHRHQQRRQLLPALPRPLGRRADRRLRPVRRHQHLRRRRAGRLHPAGRRQPHRGPPGGRRADPAARAARRAAGRRRPAPHRAGPAAPTCTCGPAPAPTSRVFNGLARAAARRGLGRPGVPAPSGPTAWPSSPSCSPTTRPTGSADSPACPPRTWSTAARLYGTRRAPGDRLRPGRHRAPPRHRRGAHAGQPGDPARRGRHRPRLRGEPAARPEQRPGRLRHGRAAGPAARLPEGDRPRRRGRGSRRSGACRSRRGPACGSRRCSTPPLAGRLRALCVIGEDVAQTDPDADHVARGPGRLRARRLPGDLPVRDRPAAPTSCCRPRRCWRRTAPSSTSTAGSSGSGPPWPRRGRPAPTSTILHAVAARAGRRPGLPHSGRGAGRVRPARARSSPGSPTTGWTARAPLHWPCRDPGRPGRGHAVPGAVRHPGRAGAPRRRGRSCRPASSPTTSYPLILVTGRRLGALQLRHA